MVAANLQMTSCGLMVLLHDDVTQCSRIEEGQTARNVNRLHNAEQLCIVSIIIFIC